MEIPSINDIVTGNSSKKNINVYDNVSNSIAKHSMYYQRTKCGVFTN